MTPIGHIGQPKKRTASRPVAEFFVQAPRFRGISLFVKLLPYMEQSAEAEGWDEIDPLNNTVGGPNSKTAFVWQSLLCPSDVVRVNPIDSGSNRC